MGSLISEGMKEILNDREQTERMYEFLLDNDKIGSSIELVIDGKTRLIIYSLK